MSAATHTLGRSPAWVVHAGALRRFAAVFVAGGLAGMIVGGIGSRVAMRIAAIAAPESVRGVPTEAGARIGEITLEGTLFLLLFAGVSSAFVGTSFYLAVRSWLPRRRWIRGLAFGTLELLVFGTLILDAGNPDFTILGNSVLNVALFGSLFMLHGVLLVLLVEPSGRLVGWVAGETRWRGAAVDVAAALAATLTVLLTAIIIPAFGLRLGPLGPAVAVLVACAVGLAALDPGRTRPLTRPLLTLVGGVALALIAVGGTVQLFDELTAILG